jgi:hypothetical protein
LAQLAEIAHECWQSLWRILYCQLRLKRRGINIFKSHMLLLLT